VVLSSDDETLPPAQPKALFGKEPVAIVLSDDSTSQSKPISLFDKQAVQLELSDDSDDDFIIHKIQRNRAARAAILNLTEHEMAIELLKTQRDTEGDSQDDMIIQIEKAITASTSKPDLTSRSDLKKLERQKLREEKEALKESRKNAKKVNHKRDKYATSKEMIVEISTDLMARSGEEVVSLLQELEVECVYSSNPLPCSLLFKRKVESYY
jgi:hypothetical protein